jgi:hypothetical protein
MLARRKRLYIGVMILGGVALFVDRFVLPDDATANPLSEPPADTRVSEAVVEPSTPEGTMSIPDLPFPRAVERFTFGNEIHDLFAPPQAVRNGAPSAGLEGSVEAAQKERNGRDSDRATFAAGHELTGLLTREGLRIAIVNDRWLRIGDSVDGCTLKDTSGEAARFECPDGEVVLTTGRSREGGGD